MFSDFIPSFDEASYGSYNEKAGRLPGGSNSMVESQPSKLLVAGSIPVSRSINHLGSIFYKPSLLERTGSFVQSCADLDVPRCTRM